MGFLEKIFGGKKPEERPSKPFFLGEVPELLDSRAREEFQGLEKKVFSKFAEIKHSLRELDSLLKEFNEKDLSTEEGNKRLRKIVSTSKKSVYAKMSSLLKKLEPPSVHEFRALKDYSTNANSLIDSELKTFARTISYTGIVMKEEMKGIGKKIQGLKKQFTELEELFKSSSFEKAFSLKESAESLSSLKKSIESGEKTLSSLESGISSKEAELKKARESLSSFDSSPELSEFRELNGKKRSFLEKKSELKNRFLQLLSPVDKPLKRFSKLVESGQFPLEKEEEEFLFSYKSEPFSAFRKDPKAVRLKRILSQLKKLVKDNTLSLKEKEKEKKLSAIDELMETDFFGELFWETNRIDSEINAIEKRLSQSNAFRKRQELESGVKSLESVLSSLKESFSKSGPSPQELRKKLGEKRAELESELSEFFGAEVSLKGT